MRAGCVRVRRVPCGPYGLLSPAGVLIIGRRRGGLVAPQNSVGRMGDRETPSAIDRDISGSKSPGTGRGDVSGKFKLAKHTLARERPSF